MWDNVWEVIATYIVRDRDTEAGGNVVLTTRNHSPENDLKLHRCANHISLFLSFSL
jgi:hypothetical protein